MIPGSAGSSIPRRHFQSQASPAIEVGLLVHRVDDAAAIDERDLVGDLFDVLRVVRRKENAAAFVGHDGGQLAQDLVTRDRIEAGCRFVENQQSRTSRQHQKQVAFTR